MDVEEAHSDDDGERDDDALDEMYAQYQERKGGTSEALKREARRSRAAKASLAADELMTQSALQDGDMQRYLDQLSEGGTKGQQRHSDSEIEDAEDSSDLDDEEGDERDGLVGAGAAQVEGGSELNASSDAVAARWVGSHALLAEVDEEEEDRMLDAQMAKNSDRVVHQDDGGEQDEHDSGHSEDEERVSRIAQEVLASMPKTDKQKRHEKRKKLMAR